MITIEKINDIDIKKYLQDPSSLWSFDKNKHAIKQLLPIPDKYDYDTYDQINKQYTQYIQNNYFPKHCGQRKLLYSEIQFIQKVKQIVTVNNQKILLLYIASAHGMHIQFLFYLFPEITWILVDPANYCLIIDYEYSMNNKFTKYYDFKELKWKHLSLTSVLPEKPEKSYIIEDTPVMKTFEGKEVKYQYFTDFGIMQNAIHKNKNVYIINDFFDYDCIKHIMQLRDNIEHDLFLYVNDMRISTDQKSVIKDDTDQEVWSYLFKADFSLLKFKTSYYQRDNQYSKYRYDLMMQKLDQYGLKHNKINYDEQYFLVSDCVLYSQINPKLFSNESRQFINRWKMGDKEIVLKNISIKNFEIFHQLIMTNLRIQNTEDWELTEQEKSIIGDSGDFKRYYDFLVSLKILSSIRNKSIFQIFKNDRKYDFITGYSKQYAIKDNDREQE